MNVLARETHSKLTRVSAAGHKLIAEIRELYRRDIVRLDDNKDVARLVAKDWFDMTDTGFY